MIIDFHTHVFPPEIIAGRVEVAAREEWFGQLYGKPSARMATAEDLIAEMDRAGVNKAVVCGFAFCDLDLCAQCNSYVAEAALRWPDRIAGFAVVPPLDPGAAAELERCLSLGLTGIGELMPDGQDFDLSDTERLRPLAEWAAAERLPLLVHMSEPVGHGYPGKGHTTPEKGLEFARTFPGLTIIFAHWGGGLLFYELMPEVREALAGVYYDCAASPYLYESAIFKTAVDLLGPGKILFGSDFPLISPERYLQELGGAGLSKEEIFAIMGGNAARILEGRTP